MLVHSSKLEEKRSAAKLRVRQRQNELETLSIRSYSESIKNSSTSKSEKKIIFRNNTSNHPSAIDLKNHRNRSMMQLSSSSSMCREESNLLQQSLDHINMKIQQGKDRSLENIRSIQLKASQASLKAQFKNHLHQEQFKERQEKLFASYVLSRKKFEDKYYKQRQQQQE